jgi:hypothetical protein
MQLPIPFLSASVAPLDNECLSPVIDSSFVLGLGVLTARRVAAEESPYKSDSGLLLTPNSFLL